MGCTKDSCEHCHCQWGLSGIFLGAFILLAAGVFTVFPAYFHVFEWPWYIILCYVWAGLGAFIFVAGCCCECCPWHRCKNDGDNKVAKAREAQEVPTPYVMI